jgi:hypothetical protein
MYTQNVHINCMQFCCNIAHELNGIGMKNKRILVGHMTKSIICVTESTNLSTSSATLTVLKMAFQVETAKCVLWFDESRSAITV